MAKTKVVIEFTNESKVELGKQDGAFKLIVGDTVYIDKILNEYNEKFIVSVKNMMVGNDGMNRVLFYYSNKNAVTNL